LRYAAVVLAAAILVMSGCGSTASDGHFASEQFRFSVSYDPAKMDADVISAGTREDSHWSWPGAGRIDGDTFMFRVVLKDPTSVSSVERGDVTFLAVKTPRAAEPPTLAAFRDEPRMRDLRTEGFLTSEPRAVTLNGLPAFRWAYRMLGLDVVNYTVYAGGLVYDINVRSATKRWASVQVPLNAVAESFTVVR
jgi:uncharacterized protein YceK